MLCWLAFGALEGDLQLEYLGAQRQNDPKRERLNPGPELTKNCPFCLRECPFWDLFGRPAISRFQVRWLDYSGATTISPASHATVPHYAISAQQKRH